MHTAAVSCQGAMFKHTVVIHYTAAASWQGAMFKHTVVIHTAAAMRV